MKIFKSKAFKIIAVILCIILLIAGGAYAYVRYTLGKIHTVTLKETPEQLNVVPYQPSTPNSDKNPDIKNIALIGIDAKNPDGSQRSDSVMVASIDMEHKKIKLTSFMRDTYIEEPGKGYTRMGHTFSDAGAPSVIRTLNKNFNLDIVDYVRVDFEGLTKIVDAIGGVTMDIKSYEIPSMSAVGIKKAGTYNLNGKQVLAYSRIRHQGNGDYERTERQRDVIEKIFTKLSSQGKTAMASTLTKILPFLETSLTTNQILDVGYRIVTEGVRKVEQSRIPYDGLGKAATIDGQYYLTFDAEPTLQKLHKFIYED